jgi:hypothetical protein
MAITFNKASETSSFTTSYVGPDNKHTISYTVPAGTDVLTIRLGGATSPLTSATFNGDPLTEKDNQSDGNTRGVHYWDLNSPDVGTYDLVLSTSLARSYDIVIDSLAGVDTTVTSPQDSSNSITTHQLITLTTVVGDFVLDVATISNTATPDSGQTTQLLNTNYISASSKTATTTSTTIGWTQTNSRTAQIAVAYRQTSASLAIDTAPTSIVNGVANSFTISNPATTPTTGNTTVGIGSVDITPSSITGSDPYVINFTAPISFASKFNNTGFTWTVTVVAETVNSGTIPYLEAVGDDFVDCVFGSIDVASNDSVYFGDTASTLENAQYVYENVTGPDSIAITAISNEGYVSLASAPSATQTFDGYAINSDGTVRAVKTFTISIEAGGGSIEVKNSTSAAGYVSSSTSYDTGSLAIDTVSAITHTSNGLNYTANQRLAVSLGSSVSRVVGGIPFTSAGRVAISTAAVSYYSNGRPFTADGQIAVNILSGVITCSGILSCSDIISCGE